MANEFVIKNGLICNGTFILSGSLNTPSNTTATFGSVGIGTTTPNNSKLHVYGDHISGHSVVKIQTITSIGGGGVPSLAFYDSDGSRNTLVYAASDGTYLANEVAKPIIFSTNSTEKMRILSDGNVGIGSSSPAYKLDVNGTTRSTTLTDGSVSINSGDLLFAADGGGNGFQFDYYNTKMYIGNNAGSTWYMGIQDDGNVGIGTTSPNTLLNVNGSNPFVRINNTSTGNFGIKIGYNNSDNWGLTLSHDPSLAACYIDSTYPATSGQPYGDIYFRQYVSSTMTTRMTIKADGGNVGIGTTSPGYKLEVHGAILARDTVANDTTDWIGIQYKGTSGAHESKFRWLDFRGQVNAEIANNLQDDGVGTQAAHLVFKTATAGTLSEKLRITRDGNVGIGTTAPTAKLHVESGAVSTPRGGSNTKFFFASNAGGGLGFNYFELQAPSASSADILFSASSTSAYGIVRYDNTINAMSLWANSAQRITILSDGNVGIGTTSPGYKLEVVGNLKTTSTITNDGGIYYGGGSNLDINQYNNGYMRFLTNNNEKMRIDSSGNILIGGTSTTNSPIEFQQDGDALIKRLFVTTTSGNVYAYINCQDGYESVLQFGGQTNYNNGVIKYSDASNFMSFWTSAAEKMRLDSSGRLIVGVTSAYNSSRLFQVKDGLLIGNSFYVYSSLDTNSTGDLIMTSNANPANLGSNSNIVFKLGTSGGGGPTERMRIVSDGNVGIGTSSPAAKLDIVGTNSTIALSFGNTVPNNPLFINTYGGAQGIGMDSADAGIRLVGDYASGGNRLVDIGYYSSGTIAHANWVSRVRVLNNGNVGIGTTSIYQLLTVNGIIEAGANGTTTGGPVFYIKYNGAGNDYINSIGSEYSSGNTILGYGATGKSSAAGYVSTFDNFSSHRGALNIGAGTLNFLNSRTSLSTTAGSDVPMTSSFYIASDGNVGIGTTSPTQKLHVAGNARINGIGAFGIGQSNWDTGIYGVEIGGVGNALWANAGSYLELHNNGYFDSGGWKYANTAASSRYELGVGLHYWFTAASGTAGNALTWSEKMRIENNGNVGIGTSSPAGKLDVRAGSGGEIILGTYDANYTVRVQSGDQLNFYNGASAGAAYINYGGGQTVLSQNLHVEKATGGTAGLVRIKSDGNLGIGTTSPNYKLDVAGQISMHDEAQDIDSRFYGGTFLRGWQSFTNGSEANITYTTDTTCPVGIEVLSVSTFVWARGPKIRLDKTQNYEVELWVKRQTANTAGDFYFVVSNYDSSGNVIGGDGTDWHYPVAVNPLSSAWTKYTYIVGPYGGAKDHSSSARYISVGFIANYTTGTDVIYLTGFKCRPIPKYQNNNLTLYNNGSVGIGTTSPIAKLDINGTSNFAANVYHSVGGQKFFAGSGGSYAYIYTGTTALNFLNSNDTSTLMTLINGGNLGIGTTSPSYKLDVYSANDSAIRIRNGAGSANNGLALCVGSGTPWLDILEGSEFRIKGNTYANIGSWNSGNNTKLLIDGNSNVGIGTTSPSAKLDVVGNYMSFGPTTTAARRRQTIAGEITVAGNNTTTKLFTCGTFGVGTISVIAFITDTTNCATAIFSFCHNNPSSGGTGIQTSNRLSFTSEASGSITGLALGMGNTNPSTQYEITVTYSGPTAPKVIFSAEGHGSQVWAL